jgi:nitrite reductase/ring-hydroxylating ferredoxin subunit
VDDYVKVCLTSVLEEGKMKTFNIGEQSILLARHQGKVYALDGECSHDGGNLGEGELVNGQIECPRHGARFDLATGSVLRMPAVIGLKKFEAKEEGGHIYVAI